MTIDKRKNRIISIVLNLSVVIMEIVAFILSFKINSYNMFMFYTEDSNYIAGIICLIVAIFQINSLINGRSELPLIIRILKYIAVCLLMLTFIVVIVVLAPMYGGLEGYKMFLFKGSMLYQHLLCPTAALISFIFFEREGKLPKKSVYIALIPTIIYAIIIILLNVLKIVEGPYPFLMVYNQSAFTSIIWFFLIMGSAFLIAYFVYLIINIKK